MRSPAAHFVQESIACFENKYKLAISAPEVANKPIDEVVDQSENPDFDFTSIYSKESSNLIVLISELYNFQVISCVLVYDIIRLLLDGDNLTEISVELVLKIARSTFFLSDVSSFLTSLDRFWITASK